MNIVFILSKAKKRMKYSIVKMRLLSLMTRNHLKRKSQKYMLEFMFYVSKNIIKMLKIKILMSFNGIKIFSYKKWQLIILIFSYFSLLLYLHKLNAISMIS